MQFPKLSPNMHIPGLTRVKPIARRLSNVRPPRMPLPQLPPLALFFLFFPVVCSFVALVLSIICVSAGSGAKMGSLEGFDVYTFNTSRIGITSINNTITAHFNNVTNTTTYSSCLFPDANASPAVQNTTARLLLDIENGARNSSKSIARYLGLYSFYSVHMLTYCEGYYTGSSSPPNHRSVSKCAPSRRLFYFLPEPILENQLVASTANITLEELGWNAGEDTALYNLRFYFRAGFVLFIFAIVTTGLAFIGALVKVLDDGRTGTTLNYSVFATVAWVMLLVSAVVMTVGAVKSVRALNADGSEADVHARVGGRWMAAAWSAVALMMCAEAVRMVEILVERRRLKAYVSEAKDVMEEAKQEGSVERVVAGVDGGEGDASKA